MRTIATLLLACSCTIRTLAATTCAADNCLRAVRATSASPFPSSASKDCSSFLRQTVTPCPATTVVTVSVTSSLATSTVTDVSTVTSTETFTRFDTETSTTTTILDTLTETSNVVITETQTIPGSTTTVTVNGLPVDVAPRSPVKPAIHARQSPAEACTATTRGASDIPRYASACSGTARYSSACACAGITGTVTTLSQTTSTSTTTTTVMVTPILTTTSVVTIPTVVTITSTVVVPVDFETTVDTITQTSPSTITASTTVDTTVTMSLAPVCSSYLIYVATGKRAGQALRSYPPSDGQRLGSVEFDLAATASTWTIDSSGVVSDGPYLWRTQDGLDSVILATLDTYKIYTSFNPLICKVPSDSGIGELTCTYRGSLATFYTCNGDNTLLTASPLPDSFQQTCSQVGLTYAKVC